MVLAYDPKDIRTLIGGPVGLSNTRITVLGINFLGTHRAHEAVGQDQKQQNHRRPQNHCHLW
jgi:hypothetical protein